MTDPTTMPAAADPGAVQYAARAYGATKIYGSGDAEIRALDGVDVGFERGRFTAVMGPSGSGKSTLIQCMAGLDYVTSGRIFIGDVEIQGLNPTEMTIIRREKMGFVFQAYNLVPSLTAEKNILLPFRLSKTDVDTEFYDQVIRTIGLTDRLKHKPSELSGGQQQRVAVARALVGRPELLFADEPTGNLDSRTSEEVLGLIRDAVDSLGQTVVMVSHDPTAAAHADRVVFLADGRIVDDMSDPTAAAVLERMKEFHPPTAAGAV